MDCHRSSHAPRQDVGLVTVCLLASLHFGGVSAQSESEFAEYFPEVLRLATEDWGSNFQRSRYSAVLDVMKEPVLADTDDSNVEQFRFVWLRSFHDYVSVRVKLTAGISTIHVRVLRGFRIDVIDQDGTILRHEPGRIVHLEDRRLLEEERVALVKQLDALGFQDIAPVEESKGVDGADWLLEGVTKRGYHAATRWSPKSGPFKAACLTLLDLAGEDFGPVY